MDRDRIVGAWRREGDRVVEDDACRRIRRLTEHVWVEVGTREDGWVTLYRDPSTGDLWEVDRPRSGLHGGGPPRATRLTRAEVDRRYPGLE